MTVVIVKPGYAPYEADINGLDEMQKVVGGIIQAIYPFEDKTPHYESRNASRIETHYFLKKRSDADAAGLLAVGRDTSP